MAAAPAKAYDTDTYEIFLDDARAIACDGGPIQWAEDTPWRATGMDPSLFPQGAIPMKRVLLERGENNHSIAAKYFAMAHCAHHVNGLPRWLITFKIAPKDLVTYLFEGSVQINHHTETLAFKKLITPENFPGLFNGKAHPIPEEMGQRLLQMGYAALGTKRQRTSE